MATKLYLRASTTVPTGTLPTAEQSTLTAFDNFEANQNTNRLLSTTKGSGQTSLANASDASTTTRNYYIGRWVSEVLYQSRIEANTWTFEYAAQESNAAANFPVTTSAAGYINVYVWNKATGAKIGTVLDGNTGTIAEAGTSQTVISGSFTGAAVTGIIPGESVLVVEMWAITTQGNGTSRTQTVYFDGTTENSTSNEASFINTPENLQFASSETARNASIVTSNRAVTSTANTTQYWPVVGRNFATTTEDQSKFRFRKAGTLKKLSLLILSNSTTSCAFTVRKNGQDQSLTVTSGSSANGYMEDLTNSVSVAAGDDINLKTVPSATGTFSLVYVSMVFEPTDGGETVSVFATGDNLSFASASTTAYVTHSGQTQTTSGVEARHKIKHKIAGTYSHLYVYIISNARTTTSTLKSRKNGADGNLSISIGAGVTGLLEDTSNTDTIAVDDDYNLAMTTGTGTEALVIAIIGTHFTNTSGQGILVSGAGGGVAVNATNTRYHKIGGELTSQTTEANAQFKNRLTYVKFSNMYTYVHTGENTITANSVLTHRVNTANANLTITYGNAEVGVKGDTTNSDYSGSNDLLDVAVVAGATGTNISFKSMYMFYEKPKATLSRTYLYDIIGRISLSRIYKYDIIGRISLSRIYKYHIASRVSLSRIYKYNIQSRVSLARTYLYNVIGRISLSRIYQYNIIGRISLSRIYKYHIQSRVSLNRIYKWDIEASLERISKSQIYKWNIIERISLSRIYKYNIIGRISLSRIYKYHLLGRISLSRTYLYNIIGRISLDRVYKYNIIGRISLSRIYKYNIIGRISLSRIYKYNINARISLSRIYKYNILGRVSLSRVYLFHVLGRVSLSRSYLYHIIGRISLTRTYKYNLLGRVSLSRSYLWHIVNEGLTRIEKSQIYKWNIQSRVSLSRTYLYHVLGRVSLSRLYKYHILSRVSLARLYLWNLNARVSLTRIVKYHVIARVSLTRIYKYHIAIRVSLSRIYRYHITNLVSLSRIYKYNIVSRVSLSRIYKYNILTRVSRSRIYKWIISEASATDRISKAMTYKWDILKFLKSDRLGRVESKTKSVFNFDRYLPKRLREKPRSYRAESKRSGRRRG